MGKAQDKHSPIGFNEVVAIGLGALALLRISNRRKREQQARQEAERARQGDQATDSGAEESDKA